MSMPAVEPLEAAREAFDRDCDRDSDHPAGAATWAAVPASCEECGYDLRGLAESPSGRCPECGLRISAKAAAAPDLGWARAVTAGLALLLGVTLYATCSVLVQPFSDDLGGTLPALNVPGPKLWAMPLLQRPIGRSPQWPGVVGTRTALLSLLAVWLITTPHPAEARAAEGAGGRAGGGGGDRAWRARRTARRLARWGAAVPFGVAFGILLTTQGLWPAELPSYRLLLVSLVELPAAALLYAHLHYLSGRVPGRERRRTLELLRWAVPAAILAGAVLMATGWLLERGLSGRRTAPEVFGTRLLVFAVYGAAAVSCGMVATSAVGSLAAAFAAAAFPGAGSGPGLARVGTWGRGMAARVRGAAAGRSDRLAVAAGAVLLILVAVVGADEAPWSATREFPSGSLPFYGFPGPRLVSATPFLGRRSNWEPLVSCMTLVTLNLAAVWLITLYPAGRSPRSDRLRGLTRWSSVFATGAALATAAAWESMENHGGRFLRGGIRPEFFALATVLCQAPPTALIYACLARVAAAEAKSATLARRFRFFVVAVPAMMVAAFVVFLAFRKVQFAPAGPAMLIFCGVAGAVELSAAVWTAATVAALAAALVRPSGPVKAIFRTVGPPGSHAPLPAAEG